MNAAPSLVEHVALVAHVNGTANDLEWHSAERALRERQAVRDEYRYLLKLRRALRQSTVASPGDFGLDRLNGEIDVLDARQLRQRWIERLQHWWAPRSS